MNRRTLFRLAAGALMGAAARVYQPAVLAEVEVAEEPVGLTALSTWEDDHQVHLALHAEWAGLMREQGYLRPMSEADLDAVMERIDLTAAHST